MTLSISDLNPGDTQQIHIMQAGVVLHIEVHQKFWQIKRHIPEDYHWQTLYEEFRPNEQSPWIGRINPLASRELKVPSIVPTKSKCDFCSKPLTSYMQIMGGSWIPSYWSQEDAEEIIEPVCGACVKKYLEYDNVMCDFVHKIQATPRPRHTGISRAFEWLTYLWSKLNAR